MISNFGIRPAKVKSAISGKRKIKAPSKSCKLTPTNGAARLIKIRVFRAEPIAFCLTSGSGNFTETEFRRTG